MPMKMASKKKLLKIKMEEEMRVNEENRKKQEHYDKIIYCIKNASYIRDRYDQMVKQTKIHNDWVKHHEWCNSLKTNVYDDIFLELTFKFHSVSADDCICDDCGSGSDPVTDFKSIKKIVMVSVITIPLPRAFNDYVEKNITDIDVSHEYLGDLISINHSFFSMFKNEFIKYNIDSAKIVRNIV
jgi:hypothetical protein